MGEIGGHFGANLGACEIAVAVHSLLDSPNDKILWDVGHQAYPHKVLTGRRDRLTRSANTRASRRSARLESEHDIMGAGHASTAIGYAVGIKEAMRHGAGRMVTCRGGRRRRHDRRRGLRSRPSGRRARNPDRRPAQRQRDVDRAQRRRAVAVLQPIRLNRKLWHTREDIEGGLTKLPAGIGAAFERLGPHVKESIKAFWAPGLWWEELDFAYIGVVDGHDVRELRLALRDALAAQRPVVVHCATVKGKGFAAAEEGGLEGMEKWHAAKPKSIANGAPAKSSSNGKTASKPSPPAYTEVFGKALVRECQRDERVLGITAAMNSGTGLNLLQQELPERYFDVGIAEQQAVLFAAGLALQGCKPVAAIYSTFLQRAYDQIVHDVCLQSLNVVFAMDRAGLVGDDGPTHHGAFDIAYLRCLPNIVLMAPRDEAMLVHMLHTAVCYDDGPIALRYPRGTGLGVPLPARPQTIEIGTGEILREAATAGADARRPPGLRHAGPQGARGGRHPGRAGDRCHRRRRPLRQADRRRPGRTARGRARVARDRRGGRPRGRLRLGGLGDALGRRPGLADPAGWAPRSVRDARGAQAPARGGRLHRRADRRARAGRRGRLGSGKRFPPVERTDHASAAVGMPTGDPSSRVVPGMCDNSIH